MSAINDEIIPMAAIIKPNVSKTFSFNKVITKYKNTKKFKLCENIDKASPVFILLNY